MNSSLERILRDRAESSDPSPLLRNAETAMQLYRATQQLDKPKMQSRKLWVTICGFFLIMAFTALLIYFGVDPDLTFKIVGTLAGVIMTYLGLQGGEDVTKAMQAGKNIAAQLELLRLESEPTPVTESPAEPDPFATLSPGPGHPLNFPSGAFGPPDSPEIANAFEIDQR